MNPKIPKRAKKVLRRAVELGVNFIDTADSYGPEVSERLIGEALAPYAKGVVIATKAGLTRQGPNKWLPVGRPEYLIQQVEMSLRRLKLERIDLWQLHRIDPKVPVEESLGAIKKLQEQGKIRHVGLSEVKPHEIDQARKVIDIVSVQNQYNLSDRQHEDVVDYCAKHKIAFIPWFPVAAGKLAQPGGKLDSACESSRSDRLATLARLAPPSFARHAPYPRNIFSPAPRREHCRGLGQALRSRVERYRSRRKITLRHRRTEESPPRLSSFLQFKFFRTISSSIRTIPQWGI